MTSETALRIMKNEKECVLRQGNSCDRDCMKCDLLLPTDEVLEAYDVVIDLLGSAAPFLRTWEVNKGLKYIGGLSGDYGRAHRYAKVVLDYVEELERRIMYDE